jgi:hypothetical protein
MSCFSNADSMDFEIFDFKEACNNNELVGLATLVFQKHGLFK